MLDYCKTVNFNRNAKRMEHAISNLRDTGISSIKQLPDEIDGDLRVSTNSRLIGSTQNSANSTGTFSVDQSLIISAETIE